MSDAFTDITREENEKREYMIARMTIAKYISDGASKRPVGSIRDAYLSLAFSEVLRGINNDVEDILCAE